MGGGGGTPPSVGGPMGGGGMLGEGPSSGPFSRVYSSQIYESFPATPFESPMKCNQS